MTRGDRNSRFDITTLMNPNAPQMVQYRGEGGPGYLKGAFDYMALMVEFTEQAKRNPDITVKDVTNILKKRKPSRLENLAGTLRNATTRITRSSER
jgi:hypothetical protein